MQTFLDFPKSAPAVSASAVSGENPRDGEDCPAAHYRLKGQLGAGADGAAYLGQCTDDGRPAEFHVIEKAFANRSRRQELTARLRVVRLLRHRARIEVHELFLDQSPPAVACERVREQSLFDLRLDQEAKS